MFLLSLVPLLCLVGPKVKVLFDCFKSSPNVSPVTKLTSTGLHYVTAQFPAVFILQIQVNLSSFAGSNSPQCAWLT